MRSEQESRLEAGVRQGCPASPVPRPGEDREEQLGKGQWPPSAGFSGQATLSFGPQAGHGQDGPIMNYDMTMILTNTHTH